MSPIPQRLRQQVYDRDRGCCQRCGVYCLNWAHSIQHRRPGQMGGDRHRNTPANLVLLCGTATTGCHQHVESHRTEAYREGWLVRRGHDPARTPVYRFGRSWALPTEDGWLPALPPTREPEEAG